MDGGIILNYTEQREVSFWNSDPDSDDIQLVLEMLNSKFRTFGDALVAIMQAKLGVPIEKPIEHINIDLLSSLFCCVDLYVCLSDSTSQFLLQ